MKSLTLLALVASLGLVGCKKRADISIKTDNGNISIHTDDAGGGRASISGKDGNVAYTQDPQGNAHLTTVDNEGKSSEFNLKVGVDSVDLGVPAYPGSRLMDGSNGTFTVQTADGKRTSVTLVSSDSIDQIGEFYRAQITGAGFLKNSDGGVVTGKNSLGEPIIVIINPAQGQNRIWIAVTKR